MGKYRVRVLALVAILVVFGLIVAGCGPETMEPLERIVRVITWIFIIFVVAVAVAIIVAITAVIKAKTKRPGTAWIIAQDIFTDGKYAFKAGESVVIEGINPYPENPRYKYVVFSQQLQRWFTLSDEDLYRPSPHLPPNPR